MKIGLYFGTFNPVHIGHLAIAGYMAEFTELMQVWFVVSPQNPLKEKKNLLKDSHRLALLRKALGTKNRKLKVTDIELKLPKPSYTINTLTHLKKKYPQHQFSLIMGSDNLETFQLWKAYKQILKNHAIFIYPRKKRYEGVFSTHPKIRFTDAPLIEISSTFIRDAIKSKKDVRNLLPKEVYGYIRKMNFYED